MAWEQRAKKRYYYRKQRDGQRVVSEYVGIGELAETAAALDALEREVCRARRRQWAAVRAFDAQVDEACDLIQALARSALLVTGHRLHKGQWRKTRLG
jgi:hypothetical protein